jgi:hypothetical protein
MCSPVIHLSSLAAVLPVISVLMNSLICILLLLCTGVLDEWSWRSLERFVVTCWSSSLRVEEKKEHGNPRMAK